MRYFPIVKYVIARFSTSSFPTRIPLIVGRTKIFAALPPTNVANGVTAEL